MAQDYNITGYQGDHVQLTLNIKNNLNASIDLDGYSLRGQVRASYGSSGVLVDLNPYIVDTGLGIVSININSNRSSILPIGDHVYDIEMYPSGVETGNSIKLMRGKFLILPEVTR